MAAEPNALPPLATIQATLARHAATLTRAPGRTIRPETGRGTTQSGRAAAILERLRGDLAAPLDLEGELGRGGMGVVRLATQRTLGRKVAVKTLRDDRLDGPSAYRLLQEAWITGAVEHPNIVPIHDVGLEADGRPVAVFKRIEGVPWQALLADPDEVRRRYAVEDPLEWHLRTLMQVCSAVDYAHSRGVLHRDLKPENVMIGAYGEVYVVDWGIAVSLRDDGTGRLPLAADATGLAGTPAYMAPEMMAGDGAALGAWTDVYLLGGLLHAILTRRPPHRGGSPLELALDALRGEVDLPDDTPAELAAICRRALAPDPAGRWESAAALRQAIQGFLDHRHSGRLAARAEARLAELRDRLAAPGAGAERQLELYRLFGECRFGFRQALESWSGNAAAADGLARATRTMVEHELAAGNVEAAAALLAELDAPPAELVDRVAEARRRAEEERRRLAGLERLAGELDPRVGRRSRTVLAILLALLWMAMPARRILTGTPHGDYASMIAHPLFFLGLGSAWAFLRRRTLLANAINRRIVATAFLALVTQVILNAVGALADLPPTLPQTASQFMGFCLVGELAICLVPRLAPAAAGYLAAAVLGTLRPDLVDYGAVFANAVLAVNALLIWRKGMPAGPPL